MVKQLRQVAGVERVKVQDFKKGIFVITPRRGVTLSESSLRAAVRRSGFTPQRIVVPGKGTAPKPAATPRPSPSGDKTRSEEIQKLLAVPREAFRKGDFNKALKGALDAAEKKPKDSTVQQFVSLVYFALGKYEKSASAAHTALHHGFYWKWKDLSRHYAKTEVYTRHLRSLEKHVREHPASVESRFLIAYHYLMLGHTKAGRSLLSRVAKERPKDEVVRRLLQPEKREGSKTPSKSGER